MKAKPTITDLVLQTLAEEGVLGLLPSSAELKLRTVVDAEIFKLKKEVGEARTRASVAEGKLDIIRRENLGEPDDELAIQYGGTGWEKDEAVEGARRFRLMAADSTAKLEFLLARTPTEEGVFTFPDGDAWAALDRRAQEGPMYCNLFQFVQRQCAMQDEPRPEVVSGFAEILKSEKARQVYDTIAHNLVDPFPRNVPASPSPVARMHAVAAMALLCPGSVSPDDVLRFAERFEELVEDGTIVNRVCSPAIEVQLPIGEPALVIFVATDRNPEELATTLPEFVSFTNPTFYAPGIWPPPRD